MSLNYYIAFGYWLDMVEKSARKEASEPEADAQTEQFHADVVSSCPTLTVRKAASCPFFIRTSTSTDRASTDTISLVRRIEAGEWGRPKPSVPSLFEKLEGLFASTESSESSELVDSWYEVVKNEVNRVPPNSTATSPTSSSLSDLSTRRELHSNQQCICFNCWKTNAEAKTWKSFDEHLKAKSPIDSSRLDPLDAQTNIMSITTTTTTTTRSPLISSPTDDLRAENEMLQQKVRLQHEIIMKLIDLNNLTKRADVERHL